MIAYDLVEYNSMSLDADKGAVGDSKEYASQDRVFSDLGQPMVCTCCRDEVPV